MTSELLYLFIENFDFIQKYFSEINEKKEIVIIEGECRMFQENRSDK